MRSYVLIKKLNKYPLIKTEMLNSLTRRLENFQFTTGFAVFSLMMFMAITTIIALTFSTRQVTKGYVLNKLDDQYQELVKEVEHQEMQISEVRSLDYIKNSPQLYGMQKPNEIVYMGGTSSLASR